MNKIHFHNQTFNKPLVEGLEHGDLDRLVYNRVTIDEYKSKMGTDDEIVVITFQIQSKQPAVDLVNFIEKGYEWVADADVSSGELFDGSYLVFVEVERTSDVAENLMRMFKDLEHLTGNKIEDWQLEYSNLKTPITLDQESLEAAIPRTPAEYRAKNKQKQNSIDQLKTAAGINVDTEAPKNDFTESLRIAAGIR
jgi:hypothetical protein